ncbi:MAG: GGDEF domain-containing protein [Cyanobacteria bacterium]|nr:GGDEF domain-containing protein [Cyanobacteriota bacterium]
MSDPRTPERLSPELEAEFIHHRKTSLAVVNPNTFWSVAIILLSFGAWDYYVDAENWRTAFTIRGSAALIIIATGFFQKLPGKLIWMPMLAKVRLVIAVVASALAGAMLDRGYGYAGAGLVAIMLTGPYIALETRDLLRTNLAALLCLVPVLLLVPLSTFDKIGTTVFVLLAAAVSTLLGRVLESSYRRAFALERDLHRDARTDALTGLDNRRAMQERGRVELKRAQRTGSPVSVILCDLDHFKNINDQYGHEAGDAALSRAALVLRRALRESDMVGRWGGEEFMAILPGTDASGAAEVAERMRLAIAVTTFDGVAEVQTISLGVASSEQLEDPGMEWDLLIKEADRRLYRAKHEGRNRVVSSRYNTA